VNSTEDLTSSKLPPPPDTPLGGITLGGIDLLCSQEYIDAHNNSDCFLICQPGACYFTEAGSFESCSNNTESCALYNGCGCALYNATCKDYLRGPDATATKAPDKKAGGHNKKNHHNRLR